MKLSRRAWMLITALIAVAGITLSNLVGASAFIALGVLAVRAGRSSRRAVNATTSRARS
jgi:hypothetical protein